jgi:PAS domain S-box-containing protein
LEDANDAVAVLDFKGQITAWNKGAEAMYGYSESEALQMNFAALIPEDRPMKSRKSPRGCKKVKPSNHSRVGDGPKTETFWTSG